MRHEQRQSRRRGFWVKGTVCKNGGVLGCETNWRESPHLPHCDHCLVSRLCAFYARSMGAHARPDLEAGKQFSHVRNPVQTRPKKTGAQCSNMSALCSTRVLPPWTSATRELIKNPQGTGVDGDDGRGVPRLAALCQTRSARHEGAGYMRRGLDHNVEGMAGMRRTACLAGLTGRMAEAAWSASKKRSGLMVPIREHEWCLPSILALDLLRDALITRVSLYSRDLNLTRHKHISASSARSMSTNSQARERCMVCNLMSPVGVIGKKFLRKTAFDRAKPCKGAHLGHLRQWSRPHHLAGGPAPVISSGPFQDICS